MDWSWIMDWSWMVHWFVDWSWMVDWSGFMDWGWVVDWCGFVDWSRMITTLYWSRLVWNSMAFIGYISNISSIMIRGVFYILESAIRKKYTIMTVDSISVRVFCCFKISTSIFIFYSISVLVRSWFIYRFMVFWRWVVGWFWCW